MYIFKTSIFSFRNIITEEFFELNILFEFVFFEKILGDLLIRFSRKKYSLEQIKKYYDILVMSTIKIPQGQEIRRIKDINY